MTMTEDETGTWDIRLLSASYRQDGDEIAVELFGKTREQKSIVATQSYSKDGQTVDVEVTVNYMIRKDMVEQIYRAFKIMRNEKYHH